MSKKTKKAKESRPTHFKDFTHCLGYMKKSVYMLVRGRPASITGQNQEQYIWTTLGTCFVAAPYRLMTAAHVVKDHLDGDKYYIIKHDDSGNFHWIIFQPKLNKEIFLYPDIDLSILYLEEGFYESNGKKFADKNDFIRVSTDHYPIGTDVGVIGYPLCKLDFEQLDVSKPKMGNILMRADKGVINCKYNRSLTISNYEFTMSFNPGNSGGPIFDIKSGKLVSVVHGFKSVRTNIIEITLSDDEIKALKIQDSKNKTFIETQSANYSIGYTSASFIDVCKEHNIPLF